MPARRASPAPRGTGQRLAGEQRLVELRRAAHDDAVGGNASPDRHDHEIARHERLERHLLERAAAPPQRARGASAASRSTAPAARARAPRSSVRPSRIRNTIIAAESRKTCSASASVAAMLAPSEIAMPSTTGTSIVISRRASPANAPRQNGGAHQVAAGSESAIASQRSARRVAVSRSW